MATTIKYSRPVTAFTGTWTSDTNTSFISHTAPQKPVDRKIEPVGPHFLAHARRKRHSRTFSEDDRIQAEKKAKKVEEEDDGEISEPEDFQMLSQDPKDWKNQDHYAVLGLSKHRYRATDDQIKKAHRKKVLKHHPDKKAAQGQDDDSFFKCIQKAMEILSDPQKRRQFDSVDIGADVEPPTKKETAKGDFYKLWAPVFEAEGRFSKKQPVPQLGNAESAKDDFHQFYNFWYNFESWRTFEYQDEDVPDDNENRDQKRFVERKNKSARAKKKTEDSARLRKLVDDCLALDPRVKMFKEQERKQKNAKKDAREAEEKRAAEEAAKKAEEDKKRKEQEEEAAKAAKADSKKAKEAAKQAVKKNRRVLKSTVKDVNYFVEGDPTPSVIDGVLSDVETIQAKVDPDELAALVKALQAAGKNKDAVKSAYVEHAGALVAKGVAKKEDFKILTPA